MHVRRATDSCALINNRLNYFRERQLVKQKEEELRQRDEAARRRREDEGYTASTK